MCVHSFLDMNLFKRTFFWTFRSKIKSKSKLKTREMARAYYVEAEPEEAEEVGAGGAYART